MTPRCLVALLATAVLLPTGRAAAQPQTTTPVQPAATAATAPSGNADTGRKLYISYGCYQCHGYEAQGSSATGPRLGPNPLPFAAFSRYVRQPSNQMPPYTARVASDADLAHIYAFVRSRPAPGPVSSILQLK